MNTVTRGLGTLIVGGVLAVGIVGCGDGTHEVVGKPTSSVGATSPSPTALVDVEPIWKSNPLPPCDEIAVGNLPVPAGVKLPDDDSVDAELQGVKSPAPEQWVKTKLGWLNYNLVRLRADVADHPGTPGVNAELGKFEPYVQHVRTELIEGKDISDRLDYVFTEKC